MGKRGTVLLLVLFFGGLATLWGVQHAGVPTSAERRERAGRVLPSLMDVEAEEIARVEIEGGGDDGDRVILERRDGKGWQLIEPVDALADADRVELLLANLRNLRRAAEAGGVEGDASSFGLEPPDRSIRLYRKGDSEAVATLEVGDELERLRYVRADSGDVTLTDSSRVEPSTPEADDWRERGLFDVRSYDVEAVDVRGEGRGLRIVLDRGRWRLDEPLDAPADAEAINGLLADLAELEAVPGPSGFAAEGVGDLGPYGLDPPSASITLTPAGLTGDRTPQTAQIGGSPEGRTDVRYARRDGQDDVLLVPAGSLDDLGRDPEALRSRKVVDFDTGEVAVLEIEAGGQIHRLERARGGWRVTAPEAAEGPADALAVGAILETVVNLESAVFSKSEEVDKSGLDTPASVVRIWLDPVGDGAGDRRDTEADVVLTIGRHVASSKLVYGRLRGDEGTVLALPESALGLVPDGPLAFRDRTLGRQNPDLIRRVERTIGPRSLTIEAPAEAQGSRGLRDWRIVEPSPAPADRLALTLLVDALSKLRADRWIAAEAEDLGAYGLDRPSIRIAWETDAGESSRRVLLIGGSVPSVGVGRYARLEGDPGVFEVGPKFVDLVEVELRERLLMTFKPERAYRLSIRDRDGASATFVRDEGGDWGLEGGGSFPSGVTPEAIREAVAALATLTADRVVQDVGPMPEGSGLDPPSRVLEIAIEGIPLSGIVRLGADAGSGGLRYAAVGPEGDGAVYLIDGSPFALPPLEGAPLALPDDPFE